MQYSPIYGAQADNQFLDNNIAKDVNSRHDGDYKVLAVEQVGDTRGTEWYTTAICVALNPIGLTGGSREKAKATLAPPNHTATGDRTMKMLPAFLVLALAAAATAYGQTPPAFPPPNYPPLHCRASTRR